MKPRKKKQLYDTDPMVDAAIKAIFPHATITYGYEATKRELDKRKKSKP